MTTRRRVAPQRSSREHSDDHPGYDGGPDQARPSVVASLGKRPGKHLQLIRGKPGRQSRRRKVGGILEDKIGVAGHITDEDFAAAKAECIDAVERRFGPPE